MKVTAHFGLHSERAGWFEIYVGGSFRAGYYERMVDKSYSGPVKQIEAAYVSGAGRLGLWWMFATQFRDSPGTK